MDPKIIAYAINAHNITNHLYDGNPYSVHLALTVSYAQKYIDKIPKEYQDDVLHACWLHDTIEDTRNTYNDIKSISNEKVANLVYAVTNEKGKTRKDRANKKYYLSIRTEPFAEFVKLCDRLANVKYSVNSNSRMKDLYKKENDDFINLLLWPNIHVYDDMISELKNLLNN